MKVGQTIRFLREVRNAPWRKNELAVIDQILSPNYIFLVLLGSGDVAWCKVEEIEIFNQLTLF
jgi:hypothetical protein